MKDALTIIGALAVLAVLALAITFFVRSDAVDGWAIPPNSGAWLSVRPPPGHEDAECWVFVVNQNFQTAYGGPACFAKVSP